MKISWKRAFAVGGFLGGLCAALGLLIAGADLMTRERIAKNKTEKELQGLSKVFEGASFSDPFELDGGEYPTLARYWDAEGKDVKGRVYSASDSNSYGNVSLLIGIYDDLSYGTIVVLENTESYATTLQENYIDVYNDPSSDQGTVIDAVRCGATFGAKMVRGMILEAAAHYGETKGGE